MRPRSSSATNPATRVVQACFPERRIPGGTPVQRFARVTLPPHPAAAQPRSGATHPERPPHPATVVAQRRGMSSLSQKPPHPAKVVQQRPAFGAARAAQRQEDVHAFQPPEGFLEKPNPGHPLPSSVKLQMERYFGTDFSDVRVHVGNEAASIGALAFTLGSDIYFAREHYQPSTPYGKELLGHELTHVLQQREGRVANPFGDGVAVVQDFDLEAEADRHGKAVAQGHPGPGSSGPGSSGPNFGGGRASGRVQPRMGAAQSKSGYKLLVGAYMHDERLPEALAGHSFVAIEDPSGERKAFGFSPAHYGSYDPSRDLGRLKVGVEGVVHDDAGAFEKPGVKTQSYTITPEQAQAAMAKVAEYRAGRHRYSADRQQCSSFALDVLKAADVPAPVEGSAPKPRVMYEALDTGERRGRGRR